MSENALRPSHSTITPFASKAQRDRPAQLKSEPPSAAALARLESQLIIPVEGVKPRDLLDTFDQARGMRRHAATDILAPRGTPVLCAIDGRLLQLSSSKTGGLMVFATDETEQFMFLYSHLDRYADGLTVGMPLRRGQRLGQVGTTGNAPPDTPHLHFAISWSPDSLRWSRGTPIDPRPLLLREESDR